MPFALAKPTPACLCRLAWSLGDTGHTYVNLLLDLDGTLTDPRDGIVGCIRHALLEIGETPPADQELERFIGPPLRNAFRELVGSSPQRIEAAVEAYRGRFTAAGMFENAVYDGVLGALASLSERKVRLFLATSKPRVYAERILSHFSLGTHFIGIYGSELDGRLSDKSDLIAHILNDAGLDSEQTIMVGDREHDVRGAIANRIQPIGVLWGYGSRSELETAGARRLIDHPRELATLVA